MHSMSKLSVAAISACLVGLAPAPSQAETIQLGFILDRSGSIGGTDWNIIVDGLSTAINTYIPVTGVNQYEISVVTFASTASIDIANTLVTSAATRSALATAIFNLGDGRSNDKYTGGNTNYEDAFIKMKDALDNTILGATSKSYVNFATDGDPTTRVSGSCTGPVVSFDNSDDNRCGVAAKNLLVAAGVDNISIEGIDISTNSANNLKTNYCYPIACDDTNPYNFPTNGFYIGVANAAAYAAAIGNKIQIVTGGGSVPEPGTLALAGLAVMAGFGATRRRKPILTT